MRKISHNITCFSVVLFLLVCIAGCALPPPEVLFSPNYCVFCGTMYDSPEEVANCSNTIFCGAVPEKESSDDVVVTSEAKSLEDRVIGEYNGTLDDSAFYFVKDVQWDTWSNPSEISYPTYCFNALTGDQTDELDWAEGSYVTLSKNKKLVKESGHYFDYSGPVKQIPTYTMTLWTKMGSVFRETVIADDLIIIGLSPLGMMTESSDYYGSFIYTTAGWEQSAHGTESLLVPFTVLYPTEKEINEAIRNSATQCPGCGTVYASVSEKNSCGKQKGCPAYKEPVVTSKPVLVMKGNGTPSSPFLITSIEDMSRFADAMSSGDPIIADNGASVDARVASYKLVADLNYSGAEWKVLSSSIEYDAAFGGDFNGNGHTIRNITSEDGGFFWDTTSDCIVRNLILENCYFNKEGWGTFCPFGGSFNGTMIGVSFEGNVTGTGHVASLTVGGKAVVGCLANVRSSVDNISSAARQLGVPNKVSDIVRVKTYNSEIRDWNRGKSPSDVEYCDWKFESKGAKLRLVRGAP